MTNNSDKENPDKFNQEPEYGFYNNFSTFHLIATMCAFYFMYKCNNFNLGGIVLAIFCPIIYIIYYFATDRCPAF